MPSHLTPDHAEIARTWRTFRRRGGQLTELRALGACALGQTNPGTFHGFYDNPAAFCRGVDGIDSAKGCYFTPNPVTRSLFERSPNRLTRALKDQATDDGDVDAILWLLIDFDPTRPDEFTKASATAEEHELALARACACRDWLRSLGWPEPIYADSGNGGHLVYAVGLEVGDVALVKAILEALAFKFDDARVTVDQKCKNPARIWKLYGTPACKGEHTAERPHRMARMIDVPEPIKVVPREKLEELAERRPLKQPPRPSAATCGINVATWLEENAEWFRKNGNAISEPRDWNGAQLWEFDVCPWNLAHDNGAAYVIQFSNGAMDAGCHHNGCADNDWRTLRDLVEPGWQQSRRAAQREAARKVADDLAAKAADDSPGAAIRHALETPEVMDALKLLLDQDRRRFERLKLSLRDLRAVPAEVKALDEAVKAHDPTTDQDGDADAPATTVRSVLKDAPVPPAVVIPPGGRLRADGTFDANGGRVAPVPVVVAGRLTNLADGSEETCLAFPRDGSWRHVIVPRAECADSRAIVALADRGFPSNSINARNLVSFLSAFEAANVDALPLARVASQFGWQGSAGKLGFLVGRRLLTESGEVSADDGGSPLDWEPGTVVFRPPDAGEAQLARAFRERGTFDGWREAVKPLADHPRAVLALYAALCTPLLMILGAPNFTIDWSNPTSTGKTTVLRAAASCWGDPDERGGASVMGSWDTTKVGVERRAGVLSGLPLILDDTKRAKPWDLASVVYDVAAGQGRARGQRGEGTRALTSYRTVLLSSGEAPITSASQDGGTRARTLSLWGAPFGGTGEATGKLVNELNRALVEHHGHAGPAFVRHLLVNREQWGRYRERHREREAHYVKEAKGNPAVIRLATYLATLDVAAELAHASLELPWEWSDPIAGLLPGLAAEAAEADRAREALELVVGWCRVNQEKFCREKVGTTYTPADGWAGRWGGGGDEYECAIESHRLDKLLSDRGFEPAGIRRAWRDREWIAVDGKQRTTKQVRVHAGARIQTVAIKRDAAVAVFADAGAPSDEKSKGDGSDSGEEQPDGTTPAPVPKAEVHSIADARAAAAADRAIADGEVG